MRSPWALVLMSCGLLGEPPFAGRVEGDGVAPWRDLGPVEFCLDGVALAADTAGTCRAADAPSGASCAGDGDCASRERCLCGRCGARVCQGGDGCGDGMECDTEDARCAAPCSSDDQCAAGEVCQGRHCRAPCRGDADCQAGEVCSAVGRRCIVAACASDAECLADETCALQRTARPVDAPAPLVLATDGEVGPLVLYLESAGRVLRAIGGAEEATRFTIDPPVPVLDGAAPAAVRLGDGSVRLYVERDGAIVAADATDGWRFGGAAPALAADQPWEGGRVGAPAVALDGDGSIVLAFAGGEGAGIGIVRVPAVIAGAPLLAPRDVTDPVLWRGVDRVTDPWLAPIDGGAMRLLFSARGVESSGQIEFGALRPTGRNYSIGEAVIEPRGSVDVYPFNPVFDRTHQFLNHFDERSPALLRRGDRFLLYYGSSSGPGGIGVAENPPAVRSGGGSSSRGGGGGTSVVMPEACVPGVPIDLTGRFAVLSTLHVTIESVFELPPQTAHILLLADLDQRGTAVIDTARLCDLEIPSIALPNAAPMTFLPGPGLVASLPATTRDAHLSAATSCADFIGETITQLGGAVIADPLGPLPSAICADSPGGDPGGSASCSCEGAPPGCAVTSGHDCACDQEHDGLPAATLLVSNIPGIDHDGQADDVFVAIRTSFQLHGTAVSSDRIEGQIVTPPGGELLSQSVVGCVVDHRACSAPILEAVRSLNPRIVQEEGRPSTFLGLRVPRTVDCDALRAMRNRLFR